MRYITVTNVHGHAEDIFIDHIYKICHPSDGDIKMGVGCRIVSPNSSISTSVKEGYVEVHQMVAKADAPLIAVAEEYSPTLSPRLPVVRGDKWPAIAGGLLRDVPIRDYWQHQVRGSCYGRIGHAAVQAARPIVEGDLVTLYVDLDAQPVDWPSLYVRPTAEFDDGRFTRMTLTELQLRQMEKKS